MNFSAVILAGGKSRRMGRDKARLETWCIGKTCRALQRLPDDDFIKSVRPEREVTEATEHLAVTALMRVKAT